MPIINKLLRKGNLEGFLCEVKAHEIHEQQKIKFERTERKRDRGNFVLMQLKSILNSIFHQDSSVLKLLADKKVYESEQSPKKINSHITTDGKQDLLDLMDTSDNFFIKAGN